MVWKGLVNQQQVCCLNPTNGPSVRVTSSTLFLDIFQLVYFLLLVPIKRERKETKKARSNTSAGNERGAIHSRVAAVPTSCVTWMEREMEILIFLGFCWLLFSCGSSFISRAPSLYSPSSSSFSFPFFSTSHFYYFENCTLEEIVIDCMLFHEGEREREGYECNSTCSLLSFLAFIPFPLSLLFHFSALLELRMKRLRSDSFRMSLESRGRMMGMKDWNERRDGRKWEEEGRSSQNQKIIYFFIPCIYDYRSFLLQLLKKWPHPYSLLFPLHSHPTHPLHVGSRERNDLGCRREWDLRNACLKEMIPERGRERKELTIEKFLKLNYAPSLIISSFSLPSLFICPLHRFLFSFSCL